jgi:hypothetical protein
VLKESLLKNYNNPEEIMEKKYVFIDPDGSLKNWLFVIVEAQTGVIYMNQCEGYLTSGREAEGFLIPLNGANDANKLVDFFAKYRGYPSGILSESNCAEDELDNLSDIVSQIPIWFSQNGSIEDERTFLKLDYERIQELTEAWVPVITPYGKGILIFENCD